MSMHLLFLQGETSNLGIRTKNSIQTATGAVSITLAGLRNVARGDTLFVVGHGSAKTLAGRSPSALAKHLTDNGLSQPVNIFLYSCSTGFGGAPYALELKIQLVQLKILCTVIAPTGSINAYFRVKTTAKEGSYKTGYIPTFSKPSWVK